MSVVLEENFRKFDFSMEEYSLVFEFAEKSVLA